MFQIHRELFTHDIPSFRKGYPPSHPASHPWVTPKSPCFKELLKVLTGEMNRLELQEQLNLADREHFRRSYLKPALEYGVIEMTKPDKPNSRSQRYRLTEQGVQIKDKSNSLNSYK